MAVAPSQYKSARLVEHAVMGKGKEQSQQLGVVVHIRMPSIEFKTSMAYSARSRPTKVT